MKTKKRCPQENHTPDHEARHSINQADELKNARTADWFTEISCGLDK